MYEEGKGIPKDYKEAANWYRKAADQGDANSQWNLGIQYETGRGVLQNYKLAAEWYRKAADQGYIPAQFKLSRAYEKGQGVPQDYAEAYFWLAVVAADTTAMEHEQNAKYRDAAAQELNPSQLSEIRIEVVKWIAAHSQRK